MKKVYFSILPILAAMAIFVAIGCSSGSSSSSSSDSGSSITIRPLPADLLERKAISYSGYRTGESPKTSTYPTEAEILEDLQMLITGGWGWIRIYDSNPENGGKIVKVISDNNLDLKVQLGIWIENPETKSALNDAEIARGITLANTYSDIIACVSVGNECLVDWQEGWPCPPAKMVEYIQTVRSQIVQPVTTDDNWEPFSLKHENGSAYDTLQVAKNVDYLAIHSYALWDSDYDLWDWKQEAVTEGPARAVAMMDAALAYTKKNIGDVQTAMAAHGLSSVQLILAETGWMSNTKFEGRSHQANQKMFYDRIQNWIYGAGKTSTSPVACFYFASFDEPWKGGDDGWGLFNVDREPKYVMWGTTFPKPDAAPNVTDADAVYYIPPVLLGEVTDDNYILFADTTPATGTSVTQSEWIWNAWESGTTGTVAVVSGSTSTDGGDQAVITPKPLVWGWGMTISNKNPEDLNKFSAGHLNFWVKTTYTGKIEIGFLTGVAATKNMVDVLKTIDPSSNSYGYSNDGGWHFVSIPVADLIPLAKPAYGQPGTATINMKQLANGLVIADRFAVTSNSSQTTPISIDGVYWSKY